MEKLTRRKLMAWLSGSLLIPLGYAANVATKVQAAQLMQERSRTRILIDTNQAIRFRHFMLGNPQRLVIDLDGIQVNPSLSRLAQQLHKQHTWIQNIRVGQLNSETVRLVLDLKMPVKAVLTQPPTNNDKTHRIQIDLTAAQPNTAANSKSNFPANDKTPAPATSRQHRAPIIMVDAGHGGKDPGAIGPNGIREKNVVLATALATRDRLRAKGYTVYLTRSTDVFIPLRERRQKARQVKADLFISIHANAAESSDLRGADVFVWGHANSERARRLAESENDADLVDGIPSVGNKDVDSILSDMMQSQNSTDSARLGNLILQNLSGKVKRHRNSVETANFVVLRSLDIPSVLVEMAFLSNPDDEQLLNTASFRNHIAQSIADSVQQYLKHVILN